MTSKYFIFLNFFNVSSFLERERKTAWVGEGQTERERHEGGREGKRHRI